MAAGALLPEAVADLAALPDEAIERAMAEPIATRERILAERDLVTLERWHERAILAAGAADWLDDPS